MGTQERRRSLGDARTRLEAGAEKSTREDIENIIPSRYFGFPSKVPCEVTSCRGVAMAPLKLAADMDGG